MKVVNNSFERLSLTVRKTISLIKVQNLNSISTTGTQAIYIYSKHEQLYIQLWAHRKENKIKRNKKTNRVKKMEKSFHFSFLDSIMF